MPQNVPDDFLLPYCRQSSQIWELVVVGGTLTKPKFVVEVSDVSDDCLKRRLPLIASELGCGHPANGLDLGGSPLVVHVVCGVEVLGDFAEEVSGLLVLGFAGGHANINRDVFGLIAIFLHQNFVEGCVHKPGIAKRMNVRDSRGTSLWIVVHPRARFPEQATVDEVIQLLGTTKRKLTTLL